MGGIKNYLVDTDIFIDYFNGKNRAKAFFTQLRKLVEENRNFLEGKWNEYFSS